MAQRRAQKQGSANELQEGNLNELNTTIGNLQTKYSSLLKTDKDGNTIETPESLKTKYALNQVLQRRDAIRYPSKKPGIGEKIGEALHLTKKPEAQSVTTQSEAIPATPSAPITSPEEPAYKRTPTGPTEQGLAATTMPGMEGGNAPAIPAGRPTTVKGPALTPAQLKDQAQSNRRVQQETYQLTASVPKPPENPYIAKRKQFIEGGFSPEDADLAVRIAAGLVAKPIAEKEEKWANKDKPFVRDGKNVVLLENASGEQRVVPWEGAPPAGPKPATSKFGINLESYKAMHNIPPEQKLTTPELNFIEQQIALSGSAPSTTVTNTLKMDANGFWVPIQESNRRIPGFGVILSDPLGRVSRAGKASTEEPQAAASAASPGGSSTAASVAPAAPAAAAASVPTTPSAARKAAKARLTPSATPAVAPRATKAPRTVGGGATRGFGGVRVGSPLFAGPNKDYTAAKADLQGAIDRQNTMDRNLKSALNNDQQAMISLVSNHIGMTLGGQKGARINQAVWNEAVESVPLIARIQAKFDKDGWLSGVTLAPEQMRQMVNLAHEKVAVLQDHVGRLQRQLKLTPQSTGGDKSLADRLDKALGGK